MKKHVIKIKIELDVSKTRKAGSLENDLIKHVKREEQLVLRPRIKLQL